MRGRWGLVLLLASFVLGCKPASPRSSPPSPVAPKSTVPVASMAELIAIRASHRSAGTLNEHQRELIKAAALSPDADVSAYAFVFMQSALDQFEPSLIEELYQSKLSSVSPSDMHLIVQHYRLFIKVPPLKTRLATEARRTDQWAEFTEGDQKLVAKTLADSDSEVRAQAGSALVEYQWLSSKDREKALALAKEGRSKAESAPERKFWDFVKSSVTHRSP